MRALAADVRVVAVVVVVRRVAVRVCMRDGRAARIEMQVTGRERQPAEQRDDDERGHAASGAVRRSEPAVEQTIHETGKLNTRVKRAP